MEHWFAPLVQHSSPTVNSNPTAVPFVPMSFSMWGQTGNTGQLTEMQTVGHRNSFRQSEPGLIRIGTTPSFAIGHRALLVQNPQGNILWDCIRYIDDITVDLIRGLGGIPTTTLQWSSEQFGLTVPSTCMQTTSGGLCEEVNESSCGMAKPCSSSRALASYVSADISVEALFCIGSAVRPAKGFCCQVTLSKWLPTETGSALCTVT